MQRLLRVSASVTTTLSIGLLEMFYVYSTASKESSVEEAFVLSEGECFIHSPYLFFIMHRLFLVNPAPPEPESSSAKEDQCQGAPYFYPAISIL